MLNSLTPPLTSPERLPDVRAALLEWFDRNRRELPWRLTDDGSHRGEIDGGHAYAVWVSEVMLQQTRVEAVKPYFARWMERFPTVRALASASLEEVLKAWEGLGYYSRARNLHRAARLVAESYGGRIPAEPAAFRSLPGVGRYTAGAVMSIAFRLPEPVVDGNVRRVFARWLDLEEPADARLWELAAALVPGERPGDLNQALMELGATVCTPRAPACGRCPVRERCAARAAGTQEMRPLPRKRGPLPHEPTSVAVAEREGRLLLARRPVDSRLGGMWEFPAAVRRPGERVREAAVRALLEGLGLPAEAESKVGAVEHVLTHVRVTYDVVRCRAATCEARAILYDDHAWIRPDDISTLALPRAQQRIASLALADLYS